MKESYRKNIFDNGTFPKQQLQNDNKKVEETQEKFPYLKKTSIKDNPVKVSSERIYLNKFKKHGTLEINKEQMIFNKINKYIIFN